MNKNNDSVPDGASSPQFSHEIKNYLIDIGGTITDDIPNESAEQMIDCAPYPDAREIINAWYDEGHIITFFTARTEDLREITERWLKQHDFKYHGLIMNKPRGGNYHWVDNNLVRASRFSGKFTDLVVRRKDVDLF